MKKVVVRTIFTAFAWSFTGTVLLYGAGVPQVPQDDHGDTTSSATSLRAGDPAVGRIDPSKDVDVFRIEVQQSDDFLIYTTGNLDTVGVLVNSVGTPLASSDIRNANFVIRDRLTIGTYYVLVATRPPAEGDYQLYLIEDTDYDDFLQSCAAIPTAVSDPLYGCQWHLTNTATSDADTNVEPVWGTNAGHGVHIAIVDDGMHFEHEDLQSNIDVALNQNYCTPSQDDCSVASIYTPSRDHGTQVAGILAAVANDMGVRGVAPAATIHGHNLVVNGDINNIADAMTRNMELTAVSNNSWGPKDTPAQFDAPALWERAVETGVTEGFGGKGVFYAWAAGNGAVESDNSNLDEFANYYGVTAVCAVNDRGVRSLYSETGANLWVCAPSSDLRPGTRGVVTTDNRDRYSSEFGGTSAATPMVSGIAALLREANDSLTWRDVKLLLAGSARRTDPSNGGWEDGARKCGSSSEHYAFSHEYGFGVVDAQAAVNLASRWVNVPPMVTTTTSSATLLMGISEEVEPLTATLTLTTDMDFIEFVEINLTMTHSDVRDLSVELVAPSGAVSTLAVSCSSSECQTQYPLTEATLRFGSARHLGEDPSGIWTLRLTDEIADSVGSLIRWAIRVYGHEGR